MELHVQGAHKGSEISKIYECVKVVAGTASADGQTKVKLKEIRFPPSTQLECPSSLTTPPHC